MHIHTTRRPETSTANTQYGKRRQKLNPFLTTMQAKLTTGTWLTSRQLRLSKQCTKTEQGTKDKLGSADKRRNILLVRAGDNQSLKSITITEAWGGTEHRTRPAGHAIPTRALFRFPQPCSSRDRSLRPGPKEQDKRHPQPSHSLRPTEATKGWPAARPLSDSRHRTERFKSSTGDSEAGTAACTRGWRARHPRGDGPTGRARMGPGASGDRQHGDRPASQAGHRDDLPPQRRRERATRARNRDVSASRGKPRLQRGGQPEDAVEAGEGLRAGGGYLCCFGETVETVVF